MPRPDRALMLLLAGVAALALATPAAAQHAGHHPGMKMPAPKAATPKKKPAVKKPAAKKPAVKKPAAKKAPVKKAAPKKVAPKKAPAPKPQADPHAGHDMGAAPAADPHAGHDMGAAPAADPHTGHDMGAAPATDPHAGHDMGAMDHGAPAGTNLPAGNAPPPPVPTDHAADAVYGDAAMEVGRHHLMHFHGGQKLSSVMVNIAEAQIRKGRDGFEWDAAGWYGGDIHRLWLKSEGEGEIGGPVEKAELQALYSKAVDPYFNIQGGIRYDIVPNPSRVYATVGFEGLAPSFFDIEGALFLSNKGELMARAEGYYDQRITQRLILQPNVELNFAAQNSREIGVGKGLSDAEIGLRLRYDIKREFSPYVGVQYRRAFGATRRYLREEGEDAAGWSLLTGVRLWF